MRACMQYFAAHLTSYIPAISGLLVMFVEETLKNRIKKELKSATLKEFVQLRNVLFHTRQLANHLK